MCLIIFLPVFGQTEKGVELREVTVNGSRMINKPDGMLVIPTREIIESAQNGYDLLARLSLPEIEVDAMMYTVKSLMNLGVVQLRINGIVVSHSDMLSLDPKLVKNIKLVNRPGVRYGQDISYVIDINMRRSDAGWGVGVGLQNTLTSYFGNNNVYVKRNIGKSEFKFDYINGYNSTHNNKNISRKSYLLNDGSTYSVERKDLDTFNRQFTQYWSGRYNWVDSTATVFQADFSVAYNNAPGNYSRYQLTDGQTNIYNTHNNSSSWMPALDLYFSRQFTDRQSLTANATLSAITTDAYSEMNEGGRYAYDIDGKVWSLNSEAIYNIQLKPFSWSSGVQMDWSYTRNHYTGDVNALNGMHKSTLYLFSEIQGNIGKLYYQAGLGTSRYRYSQGDNYYARWFFRPKVSLTYAFSREYQLSYTISHSQYLSQIAMFNNTRIRQNSMEWTVGNPELHAYSRLEQSLRFNVSKQRWGNYLTVFTRFNNNTNMAHYERTDDNQFLYYQYNQGYINLLNIYNYTQIHLIPKHLTVTLQNTLYQVWNKADDYAHNSTCYQFGLSLQAYLKNWTLSYNGNTGMTLIEGESRMYNPAMSNLSVGYRWKNCQVSLSWTHPFEAHPSSYHTEYLNDLVSGRTENFNSDNGNRLTLNFTWNLNKGRRYQDIKRKESRKNTDAGILK